MKKSDALPTEHISGNEIGNHRLTLTVSHIAMKKLGDGTEKPVMYFVGKDRGMVINSGNWDAMANVYGDESSNWHSKPIELFAVPTQTPAGVPTLGCRISPVAGPETAAAFQAAAAPLTQPGNNMGPGEQAAQAAQKLAEQVGTPPTQEQDQALSNQVLDDDIPF